MEPPSGEVQEAFYIRPVVYPSGKPIIPHLLRCQWFGVVHYSLAIDALHLRHPRLLQH
jgi:hypothetical protein